MSLNRCATFQRSTKAPSSTIRLAYPNHAGALHGGFSFFTSFFFFIITLRSVEGVRGTSGGTSGGTPGGTSGGTSGGTPTLSTDL